MYTPHPLFTAMSLPLWLQAVLLLVTGLIGYWGARGIRRIPVVELIEHRPWSWLPLTPAIWGAVLERDLIALTGLALSAGSAVHLGQLSADSLRPLVDLLPKTPAVMAAVFLCSAALACWAVACIWARRGPWARMADFTAVWRDLSFSELNVQRLQVGFRWLNLLLWGAAAVAMLSCGIAALMQP